MSPILAFLLSLLPALEPAIAQAELNGYNELLVVINGIQSPWLKAALSALAAAIQPLIVAAEEKL